MCHLVLLTPAMTRHRESSHSRRFLLAVVIAAFLAPFAHAEQFPAGDLNQFGPETTPSPPSTGQLDAEVLDRAELICRKARAYRLHPEIIAELLQRERAQYNKWDYGQDLLIRSGLFFATIAADHASSVTEKIYERHVRSDRMRVSFRVLNPFRNHETHWMFNSFGQAQIQLYLARQLVPRIRATGENMPEDWLGIAKALITWEGAIDFLSAEVQWMIEEYYSRAGIDISRDQDTLWFLHIAGSIPNRAEYRRHRQAIGAPMKPLNQSQPLTRWRSALSAAGCR